MPIRLPNMSPKRELARKLAEVFGTAGATFADPMAGVGAAGLVALWSVTHPAKGDVSVADWREQVTATLNRREELLQLLTNTIALSEDAANFATWVAQTSKDGGHTDAIGYQQAAAQFDDATSIEVEEVIGELDMNQLIVVHYDCTNPFHVLQPTHRLFEIFDPIIQPGNNPRLDAAVIASELLSSEDGVSAMELHEKYDWKIRRINPALSIVGEFIDDGRKWKPSGQSYTIRSMSASPQERAKLRRFVNLVQSQDLS